MIFSSILLRNSGLRFSFSRSKTCILVVSIISALCLSPSASRSSKFSRITRTHIGSHNDDGIFETGYSAFVVEVGLFAIYVQGSIYAWSGDEGILSSCIEMYNELKKDSPFSNLATLGTALVFMKKPELVHSELFSQLETTQGSSLLG